MAKLTKAQQRFIAARERVKAELRKQGYKLSHVTAKSISDAARGLVKAGKVAL